MTSRDTDCHTAFCLGKNADIGHWFAMTGTYFVCSLMRMTPVIRIFLSPAGGAARFADEKLLQYL